MITSRELGQVKGKVIKPKFEIQLANDNDTRSKTRIPQSVSDKFLWSPKAGAYSGTPYFFKQQQKGRQKCRIQELKFGSYTKIQIEIVPNSKIDSPEQLD
ncbi:MAG: hypothetical protein EZS28_019979 [Streblomastix strix]|uniref:Uncharacterized protein n=1 Tax=Streblomastix strix TaxID=222440 RepID=A0A5J4VQ70_9EUKA|nr:MAG: hypothetical protein EZS28_019979 [Streblomastix strix]